ncbi:Unknown protein, partial [Striga hermonthica]
RTSATTRKRKGKSKCIMAEQEQHRQAIRDHFRPEFNKNFGGIAHIPVNANNFELKPSYISMVQNNQFGGHPTEDPNQHLTQFLQICDLVKYNGVSEDAIRLRLFPFSLRDKARSWLSMISDGSIKTWEELNQKFLLKYFPPSKSMQLKSEITQFKQQDSEPLYEAWDRFRELLRRCPRHGFPDDQQLCFFYNGLLGQTRAFVDAAAGGALLAKTPEEASNLLEEMAVNSYQWPSERSSIRRVAEVTSSDPIKELAAQMSSLTTKLNALTNGVDEMSGGQGNVMPPDPLAEAKYINNRNFSNYRSNPVPGFYHPNNRNHENFSYGNTKNEINRPGGSRSKEEKQKVEKGKEKVDIQPGGEVEEIQMIEGCEGRKFRIGKDLEEPIRSRLIDLVREFADIFAYTAEELTGISSEVIEHRLNIDLSVRPVKQKRRHHEAEMDKIIEQEVEKLLGAGHIKEIQFPEWLSNTVMVSKSEGKWRMCIDFCDLNKACPKDLYPLPRIDQL